MGARQVIHIHLAAPPKPALGAACNGCGVCCLAEPCPVGMVVSLKVHGACKALRWSEDRSRYVCGMLDARKPTWLRRLYARWIAAGIGCDSSLEPEVSPGQATSRVDEARE